MRLNPLKWKMISRMFGKWVVLDDGVLNPCVKRKKTHEGIFLEDVLRIVEQIVVKGIKKVEAVSRLRVDRMGFLGDKSFVVAFHQL